eukprot:TRINITY_DN713_c0_g1_i6.p1 TRINITY_DN713_c0_g1~~TRINITY_DN713_c0_g1_i6.p1  ORF type:complete len:241 (+),score=68.13 TRINITY_DN713_c0_g1_i6:1-723(+)
MCTYALPLTAAVSLVDPADYTANLFAQAAGVLWNPLQYIVDAASFLGILGLGIAFMSTSSEALAYSSTWEYLPPIFCKRFTSRQVPWFVVFTQGTVAVLLSVWLAYETLVQLQMWLFAISTIVVLIAFLILRWKQWLASRHAPPPDATAPTPAPPPATFRLPMPLAACHVMVVPAICLCGFTLVWAEAWVLVAGFCIVGVAVTVAFMWEYLWRQGNIIKLWQCLGVASRRSEEDPLMGGG